MVGLASYEAADVGRRGVELQGRGLFFKDLAHARTDYMINNDGKLILDQ